MFQFLAQDINSWFVMFNIYGYHCITANYKLVITLLLFLTVYQYHQMIYINEIIDCQ